MAKSKFSAQRIGVFRSRHFDNQFMRTLSFACYGGSTVGECYYVASQIREGSFTDWVEQWRLMAESVEASARASLKEGHLVSAREAFLRACEYYRAAEFHVFYGEDPKRYEIWNRSREAFVAYGKLSPYSVEPLTIPFEGQQLPGYFIKPDDTNVRRPTLIVFGGGDSSGEESFFYIGKAALDRGYNVLQIEGPGQRGTVHLNPGSVFRPDYEVPVKAIIDHVLSRTEVDPSGLALYGLSYGGYIVLRGAMFDARVKACIANPGWLDMYSFFRRGLPAVTHNMSVENAARILGFSTRFWKLGEFAVNCFKMIYGVDTPLEIFETLKTYCNRGLEHRVTCPLLLLAGEGEGDELINQQRELLAKVRSKTKALRIFQEEEGADAHCITNNLLYHNQVIFDWLDDVFEYRKVSPISRAGDPLSAAKRAG
jgi:pimeloyl-ACP methyl ester carboxylesterase